MNNFKINRIFIKNFKHIEEITLNFNQKDLIVLDGPNGFGKTTVFDVIELVLTGKINRIKNTLDGNLGYEEFLFHNDCNVSTDLRIEFKNEEKTVVIGKYVDSNQIFSKLDRKPDNWDVFKAYKIEDFDASSLEQRKIINKEDITSLLGAKDLERFFSLFYYVQQEENTVFLKQAGKNRMETLSILFDTKKEQDELNRIVEARKIVTKEKQKLLNENGEIERVKQTREALKVGLENIKEDEKIFFPYKKLIKNKKLEWDLETIVFDNEIREKYIKELKDISRLKKEFSNFLDTEFNLKLDSYLDQSLLLKQTINYYKFIDRYDELNELKKKEQNIVKLEKSFTLKELNKKIELSYFIEVNRLLKLNLNISEIQTKIKKIQESKSKMDEYSGLIEQFQIARTDLIEKFNKIKEHDDSTCPLCGSEFTSYEELLDEIQKKQEFFAMLLSSEGSDYQTNFEHFFNEYVMNINRQIKDYLSDEKEKIPDVFIKGLKKLLEKKIESAKFVDWCKNNEIPLDKYLNTVIIDINEDDLSFEDFLNELKKNRKKVDEKYVEHEINQFTYINIFNSLESNVRNITEQEIENKANYINSQYFQNSSSQIIELDEKLKLLKNKSVNFEKKENLLKKIEKVYRKEINVHWKNIIKDIEIPFYIYSGKIIQSYQLGCGLFIKIKENGQQRSILFVSNEKNDHDAINYLSSGQLSGLIISFTLALNKVYENNSLNMLLIDDPVQTMDEINIASFTELLRNEFRNKQIMLSTHEHEIAKYIRYKFMKYGLNTTGINIKNLLYDS